MGCVEKFNRLDAAHKASCGTGEGVDCQSLTGIDDGQCRSIHKVLVSGKFGFLDVGACSRTWDVGGFLLEQFIDGFDPRYIEEAGPCGDICQIGICGYLIIGCDGAADDVAKVKANNCPNQLACAAFANPCFGKV